jgi:diaminopropionate ammonia-lyase
MTGYLAVMDEVVRQMPGPPSHIFLQAGVGGLAAACAALARARWGEGPVIVVVEPEAAPALMESIRAGRAVLAPGPVSVMGRLDCKEPSLIALKGLARDADLFVTISEDEALQAMPVLAAAGLTTTPSGGAGLAALLEARDRPDDLGLGAGADVLAIVTEEPDP